MSQICILLLFRSHKLSYKWSKLTVHISNLSDIAKTQWFWVSEFFGVWICPLANFILLVNLFVSFKIQSPGNHAENYSKVSQQWLRELVESLLCLHSSIPEHRKLDSRVQTLQVLCFWGYKMTTQVRRKHIQHAIT